MANKLRLLWARIWQAFVAQMHGLYHGGRPLAPLMV